MRQVVSVGLALAVGAAACASSPSPDAVRDALQSRVEQIDAEGHVQVRGATVAAHRVMPGLYPRREFEPAWNDERKIDALLRLVERSVEEGLNPEDYHLATLRRLRAEARDGARTDPALRADLDILLTDSLTRLGYHLYFGKVNPSKLDADWNLSREFDGRDPVEVVQEAIDAESLEDHVAAIMIRNPLYRRLKATLAEHRRIAGRGGWPSIESGPPLKTGMENPGVAALRERLTIGGFLDETPPDHPGRFETALEQAVEAFQATHGLDVDGAVGPETLEALNVTVEQRIDQIRVNLERGRWVLRALEDDFVVVNIADFKVYLIRDRRIAWRTRAQVGKTYRMTPVFRAAIDYLVLNPTWTVPPGILAKDVLPRVKKDPGYLQAKGLKLIDGKGNEVPSTRVDWATVTARRFPFSLRQDPGPGNALGQVKFIFPNEHFVFLHDTPSKVLFERTARSFSSGCIRVENPLELAELLLDDPERWDRDALERVLEAKGTRTVHLPSPMPVMLLYWTVAVEEEGRPRFLRDVYDRDPRILAALDGGFKFSLPADLREAFERHPETP